MSSSQAVAYHSITIGTKNTWDDWHLVPTSRPKFAMPPIRTNYVEIPGSDGVLDLSTALTGRTTYGNRQGSFEFLVMNDYGRWYDRYSDIATYLHGKEFQAILDDEPTFYYEGRFSVNEWKSEKDWSRIVIDYNVSPFKKTLLSLGERWLWDPFDFENDEIISYKNMLVNNTSLPVTYYGDIYESTPIFICSKYGNRTFNMTVTVKDTYRKTTDAIKQDGKTYYTRSGTAPNYTYTVYTGLDFIDGVDYYEFIQAGGTYSLRAGTNVMHQIRFVEGENYLTFTGTGVVSFETTGGRL